MSIADVLVVDADSGARDAVSVVLRNAGIAVRLAETGRQALRLSQQSAPALVLCELTLPDTTAFELLRMFHRGAITAPFVVVTACGSVASALEAGRLGVADYLETPVSAEHLLRVVARHRVPEPTHDAIASIHAARIRRVIDARYADPDLDLRRVATTLGLSAQHVCRVLRHDTGMTFAHLLRDARLREARHLLGKATGSMKAIAYHVGFRHPSQFTRAFRDDCGLSPSEYRRRHRRGDVADVHHEQAM